MRAIPAPAIPPWLAETISPPTQEMHHTICTSLATFTARRTCSGEDVYMTKATIYTILGLNCVYKFPGVGTGTIGRR